MPPKSSNAETPAERYRRLAYTLDPAKLLPALGLQEDPWQVGLLRSESARMLLLCSRQAGKSTSTSVLALGTALYRAPALILLLSPSLRQSGEIFRKVSGFYRRMNRPVAPVQENALSLELANGSRIISLPSSEETIRGYSGVKLLIIDEASRVPDVLYRSVRPMLATSAGRLVALTTPFGKRGWFYDAWRGDKSWERIKIRADQCPRIPAEFLAEERRSLGDIWYEQEYGCSFEQVEGLVYPDLEARVIDPCEVAPARVLAGVDWGYHNPAALVVGVLDRDDVLWIVEEVYGSRLTDDDLVERARILQQRWNVEHWYCDPAEPGSIAKFRRNDLVARKGENSILEGIKAVSARLRTGRLKVFRGCANLIEEAGLYRYPTPEERKAVGENPIDASNHALGALRYMVATLDKGKHVHDPIHDSDLNHDPLASGDLHW
jgi:hypothetical protein